MDEMYLYLSSDSCSDIFPYNSASDLTVKLPKTLRGDDCSWSIAVIDFDLPKCEECYKPKFITF